MNTDISERERNCELIVALGDDRYVVQRPFYAHAGDGMVSDVAVSPTGEIHILIRHDSSIASGRPAVLTFDADGNKLAEWGGDFIADGHMFAAAPNGNLYVVDRDAHQVVVCRDGRWLGAIGTRHGPLKPFNHPTSVAFCLSGDIYVSDGYANHKVHRFSADGTRLRSWGRFGDGPGEFLNPHCLWILPDRRVVVADRDSDRLQVFSPDGELLSIWRGFVKPMGLWGDASGRIYVTDQSPTLTVLSSEGERLGRCRPVLNGAHGICGDGHGAFYLAEASPNRVTKLIPVSDSSSRVEEILP
jgi:DNA-binding beta-propeller fold protein YncE